MEQIIKTPIIDEVEQSFLDYSVSVITDRAIPSAEDGLKPVARRILWDMYEQGYFNNKKFVKCA
jgi:DNA gyrase subunit A